MGFLSFIGNIVATIFIGFLMLVFFIMGLMGLFANSLTLVFIFWGIDFLLFLLILWVWYGGIFRGLGDLSRRYSRWSRERAEIRRREDSIRRRAELEEEGRIRARERSGHYDNDDEEEEEEDYDEWEPSVIGRAFPEFGFSQKRRRKKRR